MQKERTVEFWNEFYVSSASSSKKKRTDDDDDAPEKEEEEDPGVAVVVAAGEEELEWIVRPSPALFELLLSSPSPSASSGSDDDDDDDDRRQRQERREQQRQQPEPPPDPCRRACYSVLELGCGTSTLSRELFLYLLRRRRSGSSPPFSPSQHPRHPETAPIDVVVVATDVSPVCIERNRVRDAALLLGDEIIFENETDGPPPPSSRSSSSSSSLRYKVLDVAAAGGVPAEYRDRFDLILDKGCLDTFLFRSKKRAGRAEALSRTVLDNVRSMLKKRGGSVGERDNNANAAAAAATTNNSEVGGDVANESPLLAAASTSPPPPSRYVVVSPRRKFKAVRDYPGFASVTKRRLDLLHLLEADGDGGTVNEDEKRQQLPSLFCAGELVGEKGEKGMGRRCSGDGDGNDDSSSSHNANATGDANKSNERRSANSEKNGGKGGSAAPAAYLYSATCLS